MRVCDPVHVVIRPSSRVLEVEGIRQAEQIAVGIVRKRSVVPLRISYLCDQIQRVVLILDRVALGIRGWQ